MFYYGRAHYRVSYKSFYRYGIHFLGIGTTIVQLSLYSSGQSWKLQSYKPGDVFALFRLWYLADYLAYFFLKSDEFFHFTCCSNDAKCIGNFVFHVLFPTGASKVNRDDVVRWSNSEGSEFVYFAGIKLVSLTPGILALFSRTRWKSTKSYHDSRCDQSTTQIYFILHESNTIYTHFVHSSPHSIFGYLNKIFWSLKRIVLIGWMHRLMSKV